MEVIVCDHQILAINRNKKDNCADSIVYKDKDGLHQIDLATCAKNYHAQNPSSSGKCIGDRNVVEFYFLIYTSGVPTKIVFKKTLIWTFWGSSLFTGSKLQRFEQFRRILSETKYTTYDVT